MKNITLSADEHLIERARLLAKSQHKTLNTLFREWLLQFAAQDGGGQEFDALMKRLKHAPAGRRFNRDEMNERKFFWTRIFLYIRSMRVRQAKRPEPANSLRGPSRRGGELSVMMWCRNSSM
jgi:hypothetical protein